MIKKICKNCGKEFYIQPCRKKTAKYCSKKCYAKAQENHIFKNCKKCGKKFKVWKSEAKRKVFCSRNCFKTFNLRKIKCYNCEKEIIRTIHEIGNHSFCNKKCFNKFLSKPKVKLYCKICGKSFKRAPYRKDNSFYCSVKCRQIGMKNGKFIKCTNCKKEFYVSKYKLKRKYNFCSMDCVNNFLIGKRHHAWKDGKSFEIYPVEFNNRLKRQIRDRDNHTCQECKQTEKKLSYKLHVHHIDYNKKNNNPSNLISLCRSCHSQTGYKRNDWTSYFKEKVKT